MWVFVSTIMIFSFFESSCTFSNVIFMGKRCDRWGTPNGWRYGVIGPFFQGKSKIIGVVAWKWCVGWWYDKPVFIASRRLQIMLSNHSTNLVFMKERLPKKYTGSVLRYLRPLMQTWWHYHTILNYLQNTCGHYIIISI